MRTPSKLSTRYDVLDSLRDGAVWSIWKLADDTGRTRPTIQASAAAMHDAGKLVYKRRADTGKNRSEVTITDAGRRWLWYVDHHLPGQGADVLTLLLLALEDGPALTDQVGARVGDPDATSNGRTRSALRALQKVGAVRIRLRYEYGVHQPARVTITETGRELLRLMRREPCFDVWTKTCSKAG